MLRPILSLALACACALASPAIAKPFPSRPITLIVGVAPGGTLDTLARLVGDAMSKALKQTVIVENTVGAGGVIGMQRLLKAEPDGHTLMFSNQSLVIIPHLHPTANLDPVRDLATVSTVATVPMVLSVSNKSGIQDLPTLLTRMRTDKNKINMGSGGPGTTAHLAEAMFLDITKTQGELIQYRGTGPALTDLMSGMIDAVIDQTVTMMPLHQDKRIRSIAIAAPERVPQMPDVPTFAEGGLPEFDLAIWNGIVAPKGTPDDVLETLAKAVSTAIDSPDFKNRLEQLAARAPTPAERGPKPFADLLAHDAQQVSALIKKLDLIPRQ